MKKIYYYSPKFPFYNIDSFEVEDEIFLVGKTIEKSLQYLVSKYDLLTGETLEHPIWISVEIYDEEDKIYCHRNQFNFFLLSYNKQNLLEKYKQDVKDKRASLLKDLKRLDEGEV